MKRILFTLLLLGGWAWLIGQSNNSNQLLWKINHPDLEFSSYLYGTMHVQDDRAFHFSDSVLAKLYESEVFAMEVDPITSIKALFESQTLSRSPFCRRFFRRKILRL